MTIAKIKKYNGAHILILNEWQRFIYIIFYKGQFYANTFDIEKTGDYTGTEYIRAMDAVLLAAKKSCDIIIQRSLLNKLKSYVKTIILSFFRNKRENKERPEAESL